MFRFKHGKHAYEPLHNVPLNYLKWAVKNMDSLSATDRAAVSFEIHRQEDRREDQGYSYRPSAAPQATPVAVDGAIALELVKEGRRALALKYHPDLDPRNAEKMTRTNATADYLEKRLSMLLGVAT